MENFEVDDSLNTKYFKLGYKLGKSIGFKIGLFIGLMLGITSVCIMNLLRGGN